MWIFGHLVMQNDRIVIPEKLWKKTIQLSHEGHQGIVRTKARLRGKVWWPDMDKQAEKASMPVSGTQVQAGTD